MLDPNECAEVSGNLMDAYLENRKIYEELKYYQSSGSILGHHPIFKQFKRNREINAMSVKELMKEQRKLNNNIWRVRNEIAKGDKPHLNTERETRLKQMMSDLALINKLLNE